MENLLYTAAPDASKGLIYGAHVIRVLLILFFIMMAFKNLAGDQQMASDFARWGFPDWFRVLTAVLQIGGALLLLIPTFSFYGGALLACILCGAIVTHLKHDPPTAAISAVVFLLLSIGLAIWYRPAILRA